MKRVYLDYAASTPVDPRVLRAMEPYFTKKFGNPGSLHSFGQEAIAAVDESRETIARLIGADFRELIFTGSATESNNIALRGLVQTVRGITQKNFCDSPRKVSDILRPRMIISAVEHESVLETARDLERCGVEVVYLPVDRRGVVDLDALKKCLNERTILISVMYANNEIGTIQPLFEIKKIIDDFKKRNFQFPISNFQKNTEFSRQSSIINHQLPLFHADAAQAFQFLDCDVKNLGVDLMTLSAHKIYGPKGIGALFMKRETRNAKQNGMFQDSGFKFHPIITGGGQEFGLRSGTENAPGTVGFAKAAELIFSNSRELENKRIAELRGYFWRELKKICPDAGLNGAEVGGPTPNSLPNILNVYFPRREAQFLLTQLDLAGIAASSGSACRSRAMETSYVIESLGFSRERARRSIRFSFGRPTTKEEIDMAIKIIKNII